MISISKNTTDFPWFPISFSNSSLSEYSLCLPSILYLSAPSSIIFSQLSHPLFPTNKANIDNTVPTILSSEDTSTSSSLDLLLSNTADELGLHHNRSVNATSAEELEHSVGLEIDHRSLRGILDSLLLSLFREQMPQLVHVDGRAVLGVTLQMEVSHTDLSEVSRMASFEQSHKPLTTYRKGYEGGEDLQPYHVPKDGNDAYLQITQTTSTLPIRPWPALT